MGQFSNSVAAHPRTNKVEVTPPPGHKSFRRALRWALGFLFARIEKSLSTEIVKSIKVK